MPLSTIFQLTYIVTVSLLVKETGVPGEIGLFPFHRAIMWSSLVKIQNIELKLSCGNDPVVKNYIYSDGDLDL
jgi:hypothetical protein